MIRTLWLLPMLAVAGLSCAKAADTKPFTITGDFALESAELKDSKAVCNERWRFTREGDLTIFSGKEVATARYHVDVLPGDLESQHWLVFKTLSTNGLPDCQGHQSTRMQAGEIRLYFYFAAGGNLVFCKSVGSGESKSLEPVWYVYRAPEDNKP